MYVSLLLFPFFFFNPRILTRVQPGSPSRWVSKRVSGQGFYQHLANYQFYISAPLLVKNSFWEGFSLDLIEPHSESLQGSNVLKEAAVKGQAELSVNCSFGFCSHQSFSEFIVKNSVMVSL